MSLSCPYLACRSLPRNWLALQWNLQYARTRLHSNHVSYCQKKPPSTEIAVRDRRAEKQNSNISCFCRLEMSLSAFLVANFVSRNCQSSAVKMGFFGARCWLWTMVGNSMEKVMIELINMGLNVLCPWGRWRLFNRQLNMFAAQSIDVICWRRLQPAGLFGECHIAHATVAGPLSHLWSQQPLPRSRSCKTQLYVHSCLLLYGNMIKAVKVCSIRTHPSVMWPPMTVTRRWEAKVMFRQKVLQERRVLIG